jgi:hypothetical protein
MKTFIENSILGEQIFHFQLKSKQIINCLIYVNLHIIYQDYQSQNVAYNQSIHSVDIKKFLNIITPINKSIIVLLQFIQILCATIKNVMRIF